MSTQVVARTPTKNPPALTATSPIFAKPSDLFKKRAKRKIAPSPVKSPFKTPTKSPSKSAVKRVKLSLEEDVSERNFSPLKCLQSTNSSSSSASDVVKSFSFGSPKNKKMVSFSPLFKKLKGSPMRNRISFPVISAAGKNKQAINNKLNNFSRVLDFSEDANFFTDKFSPTKKFAAASQSPVKNNRTSCPATLPNVDWSLKTKLKISTNRSIPFNGTFKAVDETIGLNNFVRGSKDPLNDVEDKDSFASELFKSSLVWQYPYLPWTKCFPRSHFDKNKAAPQLNLTTQMSNDLFKSYCSSLRSLFKLLKSKHCPYFYVCAKGFTLLFRASGIAGEPEPHALISPTTSGLRKALKHEQIDFILPFHNRKTPPKLTFSSVLHSQESFSESGLGGGEESPSDEDMDDDDEEKIDEEANSKWLTSLGLSQDSFISSDSTSMRRRIQNAGSLTATPKSTCDGIDDITAEGKVKSVAIIRGAANMQGLLNFLINERKLLITATGPLAGIPPTLLAPVAFTGATCLPLDITYKSSSKGTSGDAPSLSSIEINGPILPNNVFALSELWGGFNSGQGHSFGPSIVLASLRSEETTTSFALEAGQENENRQWTPMFSVPNFEDSGLSKNLLQAICSEERQLHQPTSDIEFRDKKICYNQVVNATRR